MSNPLPFRPSIDHTPHPDLVIGLGEEESAAILEALGSENARSILEALDEDPATASDLSAAVGTSLQNVHYHLEKLQDADLVDEIGTWYSSKGKAMSVYAPANERVELRLVTDTETNTTPTEPESTGPRGHGTAPTEKNSP